MSKATKAVESTPAVNQTNDTVNANAQKSELNANEGAKTNDGEGDKKPGEVAEPTSEKLEQIRGEIKAKMGTIAGESDLAKQLAIVTDVQKLQREEQVEIAAIKKAILDQKEQERRSAIVGTLQAAIDTAIAANKTAFDDSVSLEDKQKLADDAKTAFEKVAQMLLGKSHAPVTSPKSAGTTGEPRTGTKSEQIEQMMREGRTYDEMILSGMGDGTIRTVAGAIKFRKNADGTYTERPAA